MDQKTPMFAEMRYFSGRQRRSLRAVLEAHREGLQTQGMKKMSALLGDWISPELLQPTESGSGSRERIFDLATTFQAFLWQALAGQSSCREAVRQVQGARFLAGDSLPDSATGAYCQARARLPLARLQKIEAALLDKMQRLAPGGGCWLGREVKVLDGTGVSMEDTSKNADAYGYPGGQKEGCGFPVLKLTGLFSLGSGAWLSRRIGRTQAHDLAVSCPLLTEELEPGDVLLADRGFCAWWALALARQQGADAVLRLHQARPTDFRKGQRLGANDRLLVWPKPKRPPRCPLSEEAYAALPDSLSVRMVRLRLEKRGQRTREVVLATTLYDAGVVPVSALGELYARRWQIELNFDDLKTTLGMDHLACKSPALVERSLSVFACAYNLVRALMLEASVQTGACLWRLSFKGSAGALIQGIHWQPDHKKRPRAQTVWESLLEIVADDLLPQRPNRHEPRAVKKRPKNYQLLNQPRPDMKPTPHRNKVTTKTTLI